MTPPYMGGIEPANVDGRLRAECGVKDERVQESTALCL